ncbi:MAG: demethoxyubiquinone hydroxylase family protein [Alphaproteobacteria bacterium]|nr:demethoxyubiquinone hydroxylase family protein [Alphaproteobacteria bacterium]
MTYRPLPGEKTADALIQEVIRVDHAGEYGAQRIYAGQLAVLRNHPSAPTIQHMADQETAHLERFEALMQQRNVRPTVLMPLWHVLGYAMGAGTALMGERAAMACTVAVEQVIAEHYGEQETQLPPEEADLKATISQFRAEEMEHHDIGLQHGAEHTPFYDVLSAAISGATRTAIWLSKRF